MFQARYPPLKFEWVASTPTTLQLCGHPGQHSVSDLAASLSPDSALHLSVDEVDATLREAGSLFDVLGKLSNAKPSPTHHQPPPSVKPVQPDILRTVKGRCVVVVVGVCVSVSGRFL
jgi:hypothetical protein